MCSGNASTRASSSPIGSLRDDAAIRAAVGHSGHRLRERVGFALTRLPTRWPREWSGARTSTLPRVSSARGCVKHGRAPGRDEHRPLSFVVWRSPDACRRCRGQTRSGMMRRPPLRVHSSPVSSVRFVPAQAAASHSILCGAMRGRFDSVPRPRQFSFCMPRMYGIDQPLPQSPRPSLPGAVARPASPISSGRSAAARRWVRSTERNRSASPSCGC